MTTEIPQFFRTPLEEGEYEEEGKPKEDRILNILPASEVGSEGNFPVGIFLSKSLIPLPEGHDFGIGDEVIITPITRHHPSGGSITKYRVTPKEE